MYVILFVSNNAVSSISARARIFWMSIRPKSSIRVTPSVSFTKTKFWNYKGTFINNNLGGTPKVSFTKTKFCKKNVGINEIFFAIMSWAIWSAVTAFCGEPGVYVLMFQNVQLWHVTSKSIVLYTWEIKKKWKIWNFLINAFKNDIEIMLM